MPDECPWPHCDGTIQRGFSIAYATVDLDELEDLSAHDRVSERGTCTTCGHSAYRYRHPDEDPAASPWQPVAE